MTKTSLLKIFLLLIFTIALSSCQKKRTSKPKVLVFSKTSGPYHNSIKTGNIALQKLGLENGFEVDTTTNSNWFTEDTLKNYSAVIFLSTTRDVLNNYQEADFERYIQAGGGFVGIHAAAAAEYDWGWYGRLVGGYLESHPEVQEAKISLIDKKHPSTKLLPETWMHTDEWYRFKKLSKTNPLIMVDKNVYEDPELTEDYPIAWYHDFDGGRAFYTGLGHTEETYTDSLFLKHILGGIEYAIGKNYELDYSKAKSLRVPEEERFSKTELIKGELFEPTELTILPNLDILIAQRRGELLLYSQTTKKISQVGSINVYHKTEVPNVNAEEGFMGLTIDPNYEENNFIYAFYSPKDTSVNRLSRFEFKDNKLNTASEKIILEFYSQRNICCHTGGSIAFGKDRVLYLSTGDNSTPFNEKGQNFITSGFAPLDDRSGHEQYDAARTAGNSNDLRGKILRIKINKDGSYEIPKGNLFPKGKARTRPEIYVMGNRNPYRISVDKKTGYLYWGEVGPDSNTDSLESRGPKGYDEINQARKAGFFGWPFFVGNNYPYLDYDYETGVSGTKFDFKKPINNSKNNTGIKELPTAKAAFIWYPYSDSKDFPQLGSGGRNALAGPVYYPELYPKENRYPDYYAGKLFIYDWMRNWIKAVTMQPNGDFDKMEPFIGHAKFASPIDMEVGPDGRLYILEYGKGWFSQNPDAGISRIDYFGGELVNKNSKKTSTISSSPTKSDSSFKNLDKAGADLGHKEGTDTPKGKSLILASDCQSCHAENKLSVGPAYKEIAKRYKKESNAVSLLSQKVIKGGSGVWGEVAMPAHPTLKESDAKEMIEWILSL